MGWRNYLRPLNYLGLLLAIIAVIFIILSMVYLGTEHKIDATYWTFAGISLGLLVGGLLLTVIGHTDTLIGTCNQVYESKNCS